MQMTIDIPEKLARQIDSGREDLAAIIERGLGRPCSACSALAQEVIEFLARGPHPNEIVTFRPSEVSIQRTEELLDKNREGKLTAEEQTELAEIAAWNRFFSLIKARVRLNLVGAS